MLTAFHYVCVHEIQFTWFFESISVIPLCISVRISLLCVSLFVRDAITFFPFTHIHTGSFSPAEHFCTILTVICSCSFTRKPFPDNRIPYFAFAYNFPREIANRMNFICGKYIAKWTTTHSEMDEYRLADKGRRERERSAKAAGKRNRKGTRRWGKKDIKNGWKYTYRMVDTNTNIKSSQTHKDKVCMLFANISKFSVRAWIVQKTETIEFCI